MFGVGRLRGGSVPNTSLEDRVRQLEKNYEHLFDEIGNVQSDLRGHKRETSKEISMLEAAIANEVSEVKNRYDGLIVGNAIYEAIGVLFFIIGIVFSSAPNEISGFLY